MRNLGQFACYLLRHKHKEQLYLLVWDCPAVCSFTLTLMFSVNYWLFVFNAIILSINYKKNVYLRASLLNLIFCPNDVGHHKKRVSCLHGEKKMNTTEISHTWFRPQPLQDITWQDNKADAALSLPDRHSDSPQLKQEKPETASGHK